MGSENSDCVSNLTRQVDMLTSLFQKKSVHFCVEKNGRVSVPVAFSRVRAPRPPVRKDGCRHRLPRRVPVRALGLSILNCDMYTLSEA